MQIFTMNFMQNEGMVNMDKFSIYCDGSTRGNGTANAVGAWAYVILDENGKEITATAQRVEGTTNQRMELAAAINALRLVDGLRKPFETVVVYTDSAYLHNCYAQHWYDNWQSNGWVNSKKQPVANRDLWEQLIPYFDAAEINFVKVKGHKGVSYHEQWNDYVDRLAQDASRRDV